MSTVVACACGKRFAAAAHLQGKQVACPACGRPSRIPPAALEPLSQVAPDPGACGIRPAVEFTRVTPVPDALLAARP